MDRYDNFDRVIVSRRVPRFRDQARDLLAGEPADDEFRPHCVRNGLCVHEHALVLRVATPYGLLSSVQLRKLAARGEVGVLAGPADDPAALCRQAAAV